MQHKPTIILLSLLYLVMEMEVAWSQTTRSPQPIENFTRSISEYYQALRKCQNASDNPANIEADIKRIQEYMAKLYREGIPYWALPEPNKLSDDENACNYLLYQSVIRYQQARNEYARQYPRAVMPPNFTIKPPRNYQPSKERIYNADDTVRDVEFSW